MRYKIKMMTGDEIFVSEETAMGISKINSASGLTRITELRGFINLSSVSSILPEDVSEEAERNNQKAIKRKQCNDGSWAVQRFGIWYSEVNPEAKMDLNYYPELRTIDLTKPDQPKFDRPEEYKKLSDGFQM